jgi:hypothetical protein
MRVRIAIPSLLVSAVLSSHCPVRAQELAATQATSGAQKPPSAPASNSSGEAAIDPAKEADIRKLLEVTGGAGLAKQIMDSMQGNMKPLLTRSLPPGEYRDQLVELFFEKFQSKADARQLTNQLIPIYDKYLSDGDIKGLIQFYQTPLGQRALGVLPKLSAEAQSAGSKWGQELGRQSMNEVLAEHPELAKALQDAQKTAAPHP